MYRKRGRIGKIFLTSYGWMRPGWVLVIFGLVAVGIFAAGGALVVVGETASCHQGAEKVGAQGQYVFPSGCFYTLPNGRTVPAGNWPPKYIHVNGGAR
jgi:hypothetical protein